MGLKQLPKCKESDCRFNHDCKYCTILTETLKMEWDAENYEEMGE